MPSPIDTNELEDPFLEGCLEDGPEAVPLPYPNATPSRLSPQVGSRISSIPTLTQSIFRNFNPLPPRPEPDRRPINRRRSSCPSLSETLIDGGLVGVGIEIVNPFDLIVVVAVVLGGVLDGVEETLTGEDTEETEANEEAELCLVGVSYGVGGECRRREEVEPFPPLMPGLVLFLNPNRFLEPLPSPGPNLTSNFLTNPSRPADLPPELESESKSSIRAKTLSHDLIWMDL
jgi:hypothetical protein